VKEEEKWVRGKDMEKELLEPLLEPEPQIFVNALTGMESFRIVRITGYY